MKENLYEVWRVESDGRRRELMYTAHRIRPIGAAGLAKFRLDRLHFYYYYCYCSTSAACASVIGGDWVWKRGEWNNHKRLDGGGRERERERWPVNDNRVLLAKSATREKGCHDDAQSIPIPLYPNSRTSHLSLLAPTTKKKYNSFASARRAFPAFPPVWRQSKQKGNGQRRLPI